MFEKILYPTDFSDVAQKAIPFIEQLKSAGTSDVVILHVIDARSLDLLSYNPQDYRNVENHLLEIALDNISFLKQRFEKIGLNVKILVKNGNPSSQILKAEKEEKVSAIVLGSHGKSNLAEVIIGSVSERVVRHARTPVLVIKR
jgi:nucleotide-binding universal stress UspA family protein